MGLLIRLAWLLVRDRSVNYEPINELTMPSRRGVAINVFTRDLDWDVSIVRFGFYGYPRKDERLLLVGVIL